MNQIPLVWIPGHPGQKCNEDVDASARLVASLDQD